MPVDPDYSHQLDQIVKALNRPSLPTWLIAMLSAGLGFMASVLSQVFQHLFAEAINRRKMRQVIYPDLGSMYKNAHHFRHVGTSLDDDKAAQWKRTHLAESLRFDGEKYAHENRATYLQLPEYPHLESIYSALRSALVDDEYGFDINCGLAVEIIEDSVRLGEIPAKYIKRYMGKEDAKRLLAIRDTPRPVAQTPDGGARP